MALECAPFHWVTGIALTSWDWSSGKKELTSHRSSGGLKRTFDILARMTIFGTATLEPSMKFAILVEAVGGYFGAHRRGG